MKRIKLELTETQFNCLINVIDTVSSLIGGWGMDFNKEQDRNVKNLDRMLNKNGFKRKFK